MAEPTDLSSRMLDKFKEYRRIKGDTYKSAAAALPIAMQAARAGASPWAAAQAVMNPKRAQGPNQIDIVTAKQSILNDLAEMREKDLDRKAARDAGKLDAATELAGKLAPGGSAWEKALERAVELAKAQGQTSQADAANLRNAVAEHKKQILSATINAISGDGGTGGGAGGGAASVAELGWEEVLKLNANSSEYYQRALAVLGQARSTKQKAGVLVALSAADPIAWKRGLEDAVSKNVSGASDILTLWNQTEADQKVIQQETLNAIEAAEGDGGTVEILQSISGGTPGAKKVVEMAQEFMKLYDAAQKGVPAEDLDQKIGKIIGVANGLDPESEDPAVKEKFDQLLTQLDQPDEALPPNMREAKDRIKKDPEFLRWMQRNGYTDADAAFREFRKRSNDQIYANKLHTKKVIAAQRQAQGLTPVEPGEPPSATPADTGTSGMGDATTRGRDEVVAKAEEQISAAERAGAMKAVGGISGIPEAPPAPPPSDTPAKPPATAVGIGPAAYQVSHAITHPFTKLNSLGSELAARIRDRAKKRQDEEGVTELEPEEVDGVPQ